MRRIGTAGWSAQIRMSLWNKTIVSASVAPIAKELCH
jgi:hypothetical protein